MATAALDRSEPSNSASSKLLEGPSPIGGELSILRVVEPQSPDDVTVEYLSPLVARYLSDHRVELRGVTVKRDTRGTSGSEMHLITSLLGNRPGVVKLRLKVDKPGEIRETRFYSELAAAVPVDTPYVLDARVLQDGRGWLLMEELSEAKPGLRWSDADACAVIADMARLHAAHWRNAAIWNQQAWLPVPDAPSIAGQVAQMRSSVANIRSAGLAEILPEILPANRLQLVDRILDHIDDVTGPLLDVGTTLVHGDYWFHNVLLLQDGRRVLVDWQTVQVFSGIRELVYFVDLWHVLGRRAFRRDLPQSFQQVKSWYISALHDQGISINERKLQDSFACALLWQPMAHWLTRYGRIAEAASTAAPWRISRRMPAIARLAARAVASSGALRHMASVWAEWELRAIRFA